MYCVATKLNPTSRTSPSALVANFAAEYSWAHSSELSLLFAVADDQALFEFFDQGDGRAQPSVTPAVSKIQCPSDHDCTIQLTFDKPRPTPLTWGKLVDPIERFFGYLHFLPWEHSLAFDLGCGDVLSVMRPTDMLKLDLEFQGVRLASGLLSRVKKDEHAKASTGPAPTGVGFSCMAGGTPMVSVTFPPQHIDEEAFYHPATGDPAFRLSPDDFARLKDRLRAPMMTIDEAIREVGQGPVPASMDKLPADARMAGESKLVFDLDRALDHGSIPFDLDHLLDWSKWKPRVHGVAQTTAAAQKPALPARASDLAQFTTIELPYRLFLSPNEKGAWAHAKEPVAGKTSSAVELWHTRLGVNRDKGGVDEASAIDRTARAIYSPDLVPTSPDAFTPHTPDKPRSLDARDRQELVHLTANFQIDQPLAYTPLPIELEHLMLTSQGGYLKSVGRWEPPLMTDRRALSVEEWRHVATLGRDQYVRVVYKGYLAPFTHRASLIKVTERKIVEVLENGASKGFYALLYQRMYIVVQSPRRDFPVFGQPYGGRDFPFRRIDVLTVVTPDLDQLTSQSLFWPKVGGKLLQMRFRFWDMENRTSEASLPVFFGDAQQSQTVANVQTMIDYYNSGMGSGVSVEGATNTTFNNQSVAMAATPNPGDTRYDVDRFAWHLAAQGGGNLNAQTAVELFRHNLPLFYPIMGRSKLSSASIKRITGDTTSVWTKFYPGYVNDGFDAKTNRGEVLLQVDEATLPALRFGAAGNADQSGGLSSPDTLVVGFSRKSGAVGGTTAPVAGGASLATWSTGTFNPFDFFGGFASAKLLGAVKLSDVIAPLLGGLESNLGSAPRMVEQELFSLAADAAAIEDKVVDVIRKLQTPSAGNPLPKHLSVQAQTVYAAQSERNATSKDNSLGLALRHASLIRAILAYGSALESVLQDPATLASEAALSLVQALVASSGYSEFVEKLRARVEGLKTQLAGQVLAPIQQLQDKFFKLLREAQDTVATDVLALTTEFLDKQYDRVKIPLRQLAPEVFALLELETTAQDIVSNISALGALKLADIKDNLPGAVEHVSAVANDLLKLQQGLGVLGIDLPAPRLEQLRIIEQQLIGYWDTGKRAKDDFARTLNALHDACAVLASRPIPAAPAVASPTEFNYAAATQVLQNLRQIERSLQVLDQLRDAYPALRNRAALSLEWAHRWLQRLQQTQRQAIESANALQKIAADAIRSADDELVAPAARLLVLLVAPAGVPGLIEEVTAFSQLVSSSAPIETLLTPILQIDEIRALLGPQVKEIGDALGTARAAVNQASTALGPYVTPLSARVADWIAVEANPAATDAARAAAKSAVVAAARTLLTNNAQYLADLAAARLRVWDLSARYQSCVTNLVAWPLYATKELVAAASQSLGQVNTAAKTLSGPLADALREIATAGVAVHAFVKTTPELLILLGNSTLPLESLPSPAPPPNDPPLPQLLFMARQSMASIRAALDEIEKRGRDVTQALQDLTNVNNLRQLVANLPLPTKVSFSFDWKPPLRSFEPVFLLDPGAEFVISSKFEADVLHPTTPVYNIAASLTNFSINLIGSPSFVILKVSKLAFTSVHGNKPDCRLTIDSVGFGSDLSFVQKLAELLNPQNGPFIEFAGGAVLAGFRFHVPDIAMGGFTLMQLAIEVAIQLSFNGDPVRCQFGISDHTHPFLLSYGIFGGGGFFRLQLGLDGVKLLEGALEFGLVADINIAVLHGSGFVVAGIYFYVAGNLSKVEGFVHAHGHMDIFGLISMDVDVYVGVSYATGGQVQGVASFTVSVHILFFSASYTLQASYSFGGGGNSNRAAIQPGTQPILASAHPTGAADPDDAYYIHREDWAQYYRAFAA